jgi:hypothetical protein
VGRMHPPGLLFTEYIVPYVLVLIVFCTVVGCSIMYNESDCRETRKYFSYVNAFRRHSFGKYLDIPFF